MSNKTIAKFSLFVIFYATTATLFSACALVSSSDVGNETNSTFRPPIVIGTIQSTDITESSGIAASRCQNGVLWTHNDSDDDAFIYAINLAADNLGTWKIPNAQNIDWEDIASFKDKSGKCLLYIGEIGDNKAKRPEHAIYRIAEPAISPTDSTSNRQKPLYTQKADVLRFSYPDLNQNAETLMVHPQTGDIYVITKSTNGPAGVYRIKPDFNLSESVKIEKIAEISVPAIPSGLLTGGDISPDGWHAVICDYTRAYEITVPDDARNFDDIWHQKPEAIELGSREQGEAIGYNADGTAIFATTEGRNSPLIIANRK